MTNATTRLPAAAYMAYPFRMGEEGADLATRAQNIRQRVEQVLFTSPGERVFRPEFGFGARQHVFEPNSTPLWEAAQSRLYGSLADALAGDVDPKTIRVTVGNDPSHPERLVVSIAYTIAALQQEERHEFTG